MALRIEEGDLIETTPAPQPKPVERHDRPTLVRAFAPPTIANIGPGYDMFGLALDTYNLGIGDFVTAQRDDSFVGAKLDFIVENVPGDTVLPMDEENVVLAVANRLLKHSGETIGVRLGLEKGMDIGTGMGSSAASCVASAVAVNALLEKPFPKEHHAMIDAVIHGEAVAIGKPVGHADNVLPSLLGGFVFITDQQKFSYLRFPVRVKLIFVLASPQYSLSTASMREALADAPYDIGQLVKYASRAVLCYRESHNAGKAIDTALAGTDIAKEGGSADIVRQYVAGSVDVYRGLTEGNAKCLARGIMADDIVTAVRLPFIPGGEKVQSAAVKAGALACCISGSGPTMFAVHEKDSVFSLCADSNSTVIGSVMQAQFSAQKLESNIITACVCNQGARIVHQE